LSHPEVRRSRGSGIGTRQAAIDQAVQQRVINPIVVGLGTDAVDDDTRLLHDGATVATRRVVNLDRLPDINEIADSAGDDGEAPRCTHRLDERFILRRNPAANDLPVPEEVAHEATLLDDGQMHP
jgi:hypothetical protein